jgi:energy-coupling factor transporter transmembrane protein EcfT
MDLCFAFILILPILLFITVSFFVVNWVKTRQLFTPTSIGTFSIIVIMTLVLTWYYYPVRGVFINFQPQTVTISFDNKHVELNDKEDITSLLNIINQNSYTRNASDSLIESGFPSKNLFRIDLVYAEVEQYSKVVHFYVLSNFDNEEAENLDELSKGNRLQINEQFYRIEEPKKFSEEIYKFIEEIDAFENLK